MIVVEHDSTEYVVISFGNAEYLDEGVWTLNDRLKMYINAMAFSHIRNKCTGE